MPLIPALRGLAFTLVMFMYTTEVLPQGKPVDVPACISTLRDTNVDARLRAVNALGEIGPDASEAVPYLIRALDDEDPGVRWSVAVALGKIGPAALRPLIGALQYEDSEVRGGAALALGKIGAGAREAIPVLILALQDQERNVRENAAEALGKMGPAALPAVQALVHLFSDKDPFVNGKAAQALGNLGKGSVPALIRVLKSDNDTVRCCAAVALGRIGADAAEAAPALAHALKDRNSDVRWYSAIALGTLGASARDAIPALTECLHDKDEDVRWGARIALANIDSITSQKVPDWPATSAVIDTLTPSLMNELCVPGVSIALIHNRAIVWSKAYGFASVKDSSRVTNETLFEACSMTKPVFSYVVMKLVEQGRIDLDRPLVEYLDERFAADQEFRKLITARMVMSHTAGFPNWRKGGDELGGPLPVRFKPGTRFGYSGEGMFYLQRVVESVTGVPLEVYARRTLFEPMGLKHMSFVWTKELDTLIAGGHTATGTFLRKPNYTHANAAYTLYTSAEDYAQFLIEMMKSDRSANHSLSKQSIERMLTHQVKVDVRDPIGRPGRAGGHAVYWGLGWCIDATGAGDIVYHSGANGSGFRCYSQFNPTSGSGIVIMSNGINGSELWNRLISALVGL